MPLMLYMDTESLLTQYSNYDHTSNIQDKVNNDSASHSLSLSPVYHQIKAELIFFQKK